MNPSNCRATIMVVDDNPTNASMLVEYLRRNNFETLVTYDGETAIQHAELYHPDLILLDVLMPDLDGFETCRRLKANAVTTRIPVIFVTALHEPNDKVTGFDVGAVDYITKPIHQAELIARVTTHVRLRELTDQLEQKVQERTQDLQHAYYRLEQIDKAKTDFINVMSHELRTPLTLMLGYAEMLRDTLTELGLSNPTNMLQGILRGISWMRNIIDHMVDVMYAEHHRLTPHTTDVNLHEVVSRAYHNLTADLTQRQLTFNIEGLADLPVIQGNADLLNKAFHHLLVNAIKYTPDGGHITISAQTITRSGMLQHVEIGIRDTGIGINPEDLDLVFEKFYRLERATTYSSGKISYKGGGPGLGLAIAKGIILAHEGQIWATSQERNETALPGSTFYVRLPVLSSVAAQTLRQPDLMQVY